MLATTDAIIDYMANSPVQEERIIISNNPLEALRRILTRFGVGPEDIGLQPGNIKDYPGEIAVVGRSGNGTPVVWARLRWGIALDALKDARTHLIHECWSPSEPPMRHTVLPTGKDLQPEKST